MGLNAPPAMPVAPPTQAFVDRHAARHPVTATFAGLAGHDHRWPDWSEAGLAAQHDEAAALHRALDAIGPDPDPVLEADRQVALGALRIEQAELAGTHMQRGNPSLWIGEAAFGLVGLLHDRDLDRPIDAARVAALTERLAALPAMLDTMCATVAPGAAHGAVLERARRELTALEALVTVGLPAWAAALPPGLAAPRALPPLIASARPALGRAARWLDALAPDLRENAGSAGAALFGAIVSDGHQCHETPRDLLVAARDALAEATARLDAMCAAVGAADFGEVAARLAADHPDPARYLDEYAEAWVDCVAVAEAVIPMPREAFQVAFEPIPAWARSASPALYWLYYRSPAPWRWPARYRYEVPWIDGRDAAGVRATLAQWNRSQLRLNHVVHHAGVGHHRQNWAQARARGPVARLAVVDGASRLALAAGGTMAEGWSCYAVELLEEEGRLSPLEQVAEQHTRVRICCRAVADLLLHAAGAPLEDVVALYERKGRLGAAAAHAEAVKNAIFPGMAIMYWLGTRTIHAARAAAAARPGVPFDRRDWHDRLLRYGALPLPTVVRLVADGVPA